ncbi:serpin family protein [Caproiciproducens sp. R2]|uniref:serpin family protein n=1 Tax=Caproiciproducens sp. R2 TaxID=3435187 RepID=UPI0040346AF7
MNRDKYISELNEIKASKDFQQKTTELLKNLPTDREPEKKRKPLRLVLVPALAVVLVCGLLLSGVLFPLSMVSASENLMNGVSANKIDVKGSVSEDFIRSQQDFSVKLFRESVAKGQNSLVSPVSLSLALGMTANGAGGETLTQFEKLLGGGMDIAELNRNEYLLANQLKSITDGKLQIANSIWYRDKDLKVDKGFLQKNADYFGAGAFQLDFGKQSTVNKINGWVKENTGGKIDKMVSQIDDTTMMYLINALYFESDWRIAYKDYQVKDREFQAPGGKVTVPFMNSQEVYLHDGKSDGILKPFQDDRFALMAVLPKEGVGLDEYIAQMTGESFAALLDSAGEEWADSFLPKFKYEFSIGLNDPLKALGLTDAFDADRADFRSMGSSPEGPLFISEVLHKTFIEVDELGAKAGAATSISMDAGSAAPAQDRKEVVFDRPFLYAIVDTQAKLPVFIGTVSNPKE